MSQPLTVIIELGFDSNSPDVRWRVSTETAGGRSEHASGGRPDRAAAVSQAMAEARYQLTHADLEGDLRP